MKKLLVTVTGALALGLSAPAGAADMAARPYTKAPPAAVAAVYDWSGFYIGANGGWGSSRNSWDSTAPFLVGPEGSHDATGGVAGGQVGYRWQTGTWVFGLEAQGDWADLRGSNLSTLFGPAFRNDSRINAFGLFTGQLGWATNNVLFYVKGGAAVTDNRNRIYSTATGAVLASTGDDTRWGGTVGVGLEYGFAPGWSAGVEYDHLFMQDRTLTFTAPGGLAFGADRIRQDVDLVTVRVNYKFGGPTVGRY
ncbi:outer membrane beta-barrel protein [Bradyrhizobium sp. 1]|uniref:outer membrane protein n=1 Tax=Bradyrhizobium sp. 1 TaxID=241591 RepID=UPI001FFB41B4|nr:outer membrane beta-barrel protein [Bradyrhizobium sp. 1]MCK1394928.1 porin family protein [Bradyrhizobium sp. 1]